MKCVLYNVALAQGYCGLGTILSSGIHGLKFWSGVGDFLPLSFDLLKMKDRRWDRTFGWLENRDICVHLLQVPVPGRKEL